jgi:hypothetical protein
MVGLGDIGIRVVLINNGACAGEAVMSFLSQDIHSKGRDPEQKIVSCEK